MISELGRAVGAGERSAREVVGAALASAVAHEALNAFTLIDGDAAMARAASIDQAVASGLDPGPLAGVPVAIKDLIDHEGRPTTCGSSFHRPIAERSATVVRRLEAAGAVIVGRTGLHEFAYGFSSENDWWGPVRNPWDPATSPGGSSGGSAAAVAAGIVPLGIGTDTGGSVRVPAALCGCVGLKVTHGRVPLTGVFPLAASLDTVGPLTRSIVDAAAAYAALAGYDPDDPWSAEHPVEIPQHPAPLDELRIGIPLPWTDRPLHPQIAAAFSTTIQRLAAAGAEIVEVRDPMLDPSLMPRASYAEVATVHRAWFEEDPERYGPEIRERMGRDMLHSADDVTRAHAWRAALRRAAERVFARVDILLTPATATPSKLIGVPTVDGGGEPEPYRTALSWFSTLPNQMGVPALAMPIAAPGSPPPSIQVIAPWWRESHMLAIGWAMGDAEITGAGMVADGISRGASDIQ
jgi:Asp-tRNA(Asn)/Glu-tRNA(Gln) amidotransferase A subunit family amidase